MKDKHEVARPHLWDSEAPFSVNVEAFAERARDADQELNVIHGTENRVYVDELAILVPGRELAMEFIDEAVQFGWCFFNRSSDIVRVEPFGTVYSVEYYFLRHHAYPWRFEVMRKVSGVSPLHDALKPFMAEGDLPLVHASFKPYTGESPHNYTAEKDRLNEAGYWLAQECRSTYGRFGYWRALNDPMVQYLKPRINLRDEVPYGHLRTPAEGFGADEEVFRG